MKVFLSSGHWIKFLISKNGLGGSSLLTSSLFTKQKMKIEKLSQIHLGSEGELETIQTCKGLNKWTFSEASDDIF